jgi:hypothetical protein
MIATGTKEDHATNYYVVCSCATEPSMATQHKSKFTEDMDTDKSLFGASHKTKPLDSC